VIARVGSVDIADGKEGRGFRSPKQGGGHQYFQEPRVRERAGTRGVVTQGRVARYVTGHLGALGARKVRREAGRLNPDLLTLRAIFWEEKNAGMGDDHR